MSDPTHPPIGSSGGVSDVSSTPPKDEREAPILDSHENEPPPFDMPDSQPPQRSASVMRSDEADAEPTSERNYPPADVEDVVRSHLKGLIEALVFASDAPLPAPEIAKTAKADRKLVMELLRELQEEYLSRGIRLVEVAGGFAFRTASAYAPFVRDVTAQRPVKLTRAQLETLAIVAYRQPLTRPEIDDVRGVDSGPVLKMLLDRGLVRILGKRDEPGRPLIYGTTSTFLSFFNLRSLKDLPSLREFTELTDDSKRAFEKALGEEPPEQLDFGEAVWTNPTESGDELVADEHLSQIGHESNTSHSAQEPDPMGTDPHVSDEDDSDEDDSDEDDSDEDDSDDDDSDEDDSDEDVSDEDDRD